MGRNQIRSLAKKTVEIGNGSNVPTVFGPFSPFLFVGWVNLGFVGFDTFLAVFFYATEFWVPAKHPYSTKTTIVD